MTTVIVRGFDYLYLGTGGKEPLEFSEFVSFIESIAVGTVRTDRFGESLSQGAGGYRPGIGDHETPPVEHHELPLLANKRSYDRLRSLSACHTASDIPGEAGNVSR